MHSCVAAHSADADGREGLPLIRRTISGRRARSHRRSTLILAGALGCTALLAGVNLLRAGRSNGRTGPAPSSPAVFTQSSTRRHAAVIAPPSVAPGRLTRVHFYSRALGRIADYLVYLPTDYTPSRRLPVFYGLHGMPGQPLAFTIHAHLEQRLEALIRQGRVPPMILVFPDGRIGGRTSTDSEWANTSSGRFESYVVDVAHDVDARFATLRDREDRIIAGVSAGAYGAANVGLHQLALFGAIQVWSGYFTETHNGVFAHATEAQMADNSPIDYVRRLRGALIRYPLRAFLYVGSHDPDRSQIEPMAAALADEGAQVDWAIYPGGHSWRLWSAHADQMLLMAAYDFGHPLSDRQRSVGISAPR